MSAAAGLLLLALPLSSADYKPCGVNLASLSVDSGAPGTEFSLRGAWGTEQGEKLVVINHGSTNLLEVVSWSETEIVARVPAGLREGSYRVGVYCNDFSKGGTYSSGFRDFIVLAQTGSVPRPAAPSRPSRTRRSAAPPPPPARRSFAVDAAAAAGAGLGLLLYLGSVAGKLRRAREALDRAFLDIDEILEARHATLVELLGREDARIGGARPHLAGVQGALGAYRAASGAGARARAENALLASLEPALAALRTDPGLRAVPAVARLLARLKETEDAVAPWRDGLAQATAEYNAALDGAPLLGRLLGAGGCPELHRLR